MYLLLGYAGWKQKELSAIFTFARIAKNHYTFPAKRINSKESLQIQNLSKFSFRSISPPVY
jgi:hypothetical protein